MPRSACLATAALVPFLAAQDPVLVPPGADADATAARSADVRPTPRQLAWQQLGFTAFVHFGMNTFHDREWGDGKESPTAFAPTDFDALQWARTFAQAGMRGVVLTCKHHDGFCLWPTATTTHGVAASPWRDGNGDIVREVADACRALGLAFGVYLSPWDRHEPTFGSRAYNAVFAAQLRELCSQYGPLFEVWFDGASCPADDPAVFDWQAHFRLVRELQPGAVIAITGPDVRWVGNEAGRTRAQEWSVLPLDTDDAGAFEESRAAWQSLWRLRERNQARALGTRAELAGARRLCWWPAETDVSIRPGWFWHAHEDAQVKSLAQLLDCWYGAVGGNAVLLLNVPPDRRGRIADPDVAVLHDLGAVLQATFAQDLAADAQRKTYAKAGEVYFRESRVVDVVELREDTAAGGQRVERFRIDTWDGQAWKELATGGTIGHRRLLRIEPVRALGFRYWIEKARAPAVIAQFSLWRQPLLLQPPQVRRDRDGLVTLTAPVGDIRYTTDGSLPTASSPRYRDPFALPRGGTVRATALPTAGAPALALAAGAMTTARFGLAPAKWTVLECSSQQAPREAASLAFDGDPDTWWHSRWRPDAPRPPHTLAIDLGEPADVTGFAYTPRPGAGNGTIARYEFRVSKDGKVFRTVAIGTWEDWAGSPGARVVRLPSPEPGVRAVALVSLQEVHGREWASCAELAVLVD